MRPQSRWWLAAFVPFLLFATPAAHAQNWWPTPGGSNASGFVLMCLDAQSKAIPATSAGTCLGSGGGGGGGAVTMASGAVASGAYASGAYAAGSIGSGAIASGAVASGAISSGAIASGALASGSYAAGALRVGAAVDGWDITQGATADAAYTGSGSASVIAALKGIYAAATGSIPAGTANIGAVFPSTGSAASGVTTVVSGTTAAMTGTSPTQIVALVTSKKLYITFVKCNNSHATVSTLVQITDGSAGTVLTTLAAGANFAGEVNQNFLPLFSTTAGNGLYAQDVTTGASVICSASGFSQ